MWRRRGVNILNFRQIRTHVGLREGLILRSQEACPQDTRDTYDDSSRHLTPTNDTIRDRQLYRVSLLGEYQWWELQEVRLAWYNVGSEHNEDMCAELTANKQCTRAWIQSLSP